MSVPLRKFLYSDNCEFAMRLSKFYGCRYLMRANAIHSLKNHEQHNTMDKNIKEAEKVVGYTTSFLNLRWLLNDEMANVGIYMKKLMGTEHPILNTVRDCIFKSDKVPWGLIVLLFSKTAGIKIKYTQVEMDMTAGILHSQRIVAEVTEMLRTAIMVHKSLLLLSDEEKNDDVLQMGNRLALLGGDVLLTKCFRDIAIMRDARIFFMISSSLRDLSESIYLPPDTDSNVTIPAKPKDTQYVWNEQVADLGPYDATDILGSSREEWALRKILSGANLLGKSCKSVTLIAGHDKEVQDQAYLFGRNLVLSIEAKKDYHKFISNSKLDLTGAPVMLQLKTQPDLYEDILLRDRCDVVKIKDAVYSGTGLVDTLNLQKYYSSKALDNLLYFDKSVARSALTNIIDSI